MTLWLLLKNIASWNGSTILAGLLVLVTVGIWFGIVLAWVFG